MFAGRLCHCTEQSTPAVTASKPETPMPTIQTNDIETYYERRGEGPPVVFIHGAILDHSVWEPQVDTLQEAYETITYDVRGHGRTGGSPLSVYTIELFVDDLHTLLDGLDIERPVLCGLSMGGLIASMYASRYPERVSGLVLADTFTPEILDWRDRLTYLSLRSTILPVRLFGLARTQRVLTWLNERFNEGAGGDYGTVEQYQAAMPPISTTEFAKVIRALLAYRRSTLDLASITVPTLVLHGENTVGAVRRHSDKLGREIADARVRVVPDGGHACNLDNPEFFSDAVGDLLGQAYAPAQSA